jgi:hypothetical protein
MLNQTKLVPSGKLEAGEIGKVWWLPSSSPFQLPIEADLTLTFFVTGAGACASEIS